MAERWTPHGWRAKPITQVPDYPDPDALAAVERQLAGFPPLVFAGEARNLKKALSRVAMGEGFLFRLDRRGQTPSRRDRNGLAGCLPAKPAHPRVDWSGACSWKRLKKQAQSQPRHIGRA